MTKPLVSDEYVEVKVNDETKKIGLFFTNDKWRYELTASEAKRLSSALRRAVDAVSPNDDGEPWHWPTDPPA